MGFPLDSYSQLRIIAAGSRDPDFAMLQEAISHYRLFAFILHDPIAHAELDGELNSKFARLDQVTGKHLLFFAVVRPTAEWLREAGERPYMQAAQSVFSPEHLTVAEDPTFSAYGMASLLGVSAEQLPCIVVTNNLRSPRFLTIRTSATVLDRQMYELGRIASEQEPLNGRPPAQGWRGYTDSLFEEIQDADAELFGQSRSGTIATNLARVLADLLAFAATTHGSGRDSAREEHMRATLADLALMLRRHKRSPQNEETQRAFDDLCVNIATFLAAAQPAADGAEGRLIEAAAPLLEQDSLQMLRTGYRVLRSLRSDPSEAGLFDFSPAVVVFAKVFEREINLSLVHSIRKMLGVELPDYFNQHMPDVQARAQSGRLEIDFNRPKNGGPDWQPPGMGQSRIVFARHQADLRPSTLSRDQADDLLDRWKRIADLRNDAAHVELITQEAADRMLAEIEAVTAGPWLRCLSDVKHGHRGTPKEIA